VVVLEEFARATLVVVVGFGVVVTGVGRVDVVVAGGVVDDLIVVVVVVVVVVAGTILSLLDDVDVVVGNVDVTDDAGVCSGREFRVNTKTRSRSGLDHISRCELRRVNRRRAMVIED